MIKNKNSFYARLVGWFERRTPGYHNQCLEIQHAWHTLPPWVQKNSVETEMTFLKMYLRADALSTGSNVLIAPSGTALLPYMTLWITSIQKIWQRSIGMYSTYRWKLSCHHCSFQDLSSYSLWERLYGSVNSIQLNVNHFPYKNFLQAFKKCIYLSRKLK